MHRMILCALIVVCGGLLLAPLSAQAVILDNFTDSTLSESLAMPDTVMHAETGLSGVAGGDRTTTLTAMAATGGVNSVGIEIDTVTEVLNYASGPSADGAFSLLYDGATLAADIGGMLSELCLELYYDAAFDSSLEIVATVTDASMNSASDTITITMGLPAFSTVSFDLNLFPGIGSVDRSNLASILIEFNPGSGGTDLSLASLTAKTSTVPEPSSMVFGSLAVCAGIGFGFRRRLQRRGQPA